MKPLCIFAIAILLVSCAHKPKKNLWQENLKGNVKSTTTLSYDADPVTGARGAYTGKAVASFDKNGNISEMISYDSAGGITGKVEFIKDSHGDITGNETYGDDGSLQEKGTLEYGDDGLQTAEQLFDAKGAPTGRITLTHDDKGRVVEENFFHPADSLAYIMKDSYTPTGDPLETDVYDKDQKLFMKSTYRLDAADKKGNWTRMISLKDGRPQSIAERTITYY